MKKFILSAFMIIGGCLAAQSVTNRSLLWASLNVNYKFRAAWTWVNDAQFRFEVTDGDLFQIGLRSGISYKTKRGIQFTGGGAWFLHYPNPNGIVPRPELRPWEEVGRKWEFGIHHTLFPRLRFEQRFYREYDGDRLADDFTFSSWRLRMRTEYTYAIGVEEQPWAIVVGDEIMFLQRPDGYSGLDQNRAWVGIAYQFSPVLSAQVIYLNVFAQRNSSAHDQLHVIRATLQFNFASPAATPAVQ